MATNIEKDAVTGTSTTGHEWDGIKELNTPLPKWWVNLFYVTILWSIGYWIVYPAWPLVSGYTTGLFGYSTRGDVVEELNALKAKRGQNAAALEKASLDDIKKNPALAQVANAIGKAAFGDNCVPCHGIGGAGAKGYPNLTDDDWIWGGDLAAIEQTVKHGIRWATNKDTRVGEMMAFGKSGILKKDEVEQVVDFVRSLSKLDTKADVAKGKDLYAANCASCHGDDGKGNKDVGAPNLVDAIWLFGKDRDTMIDVVTNGRGAVMPAWTGRLDAVTIKSLAVYVNGLGGGK
ncbi:MAG TPA: cytochrome-c oxidase, cbb3-type subunit III [Beijerinckiaceae bacterium]|nr:cytochrome-c oxidase, cbb3-type subunit III [Beijerinckiaceae bacterium]